MTRSITPQALTTQLTTTFTLPESIAAGLADRTYERVGGVIRDVATQRIVAWLRDTGTSPALAQVPSVLQLTSVSSLLNLGLAAMSFAIVSRQLQQVEQRVQQTQAMLTTIDHKIDLDFYATFRAGLALAENALTLSQSENRRSSALKAIELFLQVEHVFADYVDRALAQKSLLANQYLLTLCLAYVAEARCYLELNEVDTALRRFQIGIEQLHTRIRQVVELLLSTDPAAYLHPRYKGKIDLRRLTRIYQWLDPSLDETAVFDRLREPLFESAKHSPQFLEGLSRTSRLAVLTLKFWSSPNLQVEDLLADQNEQLVRIETLERWIETQQRLSAYALEIGSIAQLNLSFPDWCQLTVPQSGAIDLLYLLPPQPLVL